VQMLEDHGFGFYKSDIIDEDYGTDIEDDE